MLAVVDLAAAREKHAIEAIIESNPFCVDLNYTAQDPRLTAEAIAEFEPRFAAAVMAGRMKATSADLFLDFT